MYLIDTHSHIYAQEFDIDKEAVMQRCKEKGIQKLFLPNIDIDSLPLLDNTIQQFPDQCYAMLGLHPCSVKEDFEAQLLILKNKIESKAYPCYGIGEVGLDFYWDKTFIAQQIQAFKIQIKWAVEYDLPIIIHSRESTQEVIDILKQYAYLPIKGILHCFSGTYEQAMEIINLGFYIGIGGAITYKKNELRGFLSKIPLQSIVLETDSPYLSPIPYRGKRNESSYLTYVAQEVADLYTIPIQEVAKITTENALKTFTNSY